MPESDDTQRFHVTSVEGWPASQREGADVPELPGATFHVVDPRSGQLVATYCSEDVAVGLPHAVRLRVAQLRAETVAARLNVERDAEPLP